MQGFSLYSYMSQVPGQFVSQPNTMYRIVNLKEPNKAFTVTKDAENKLTISDYIGDLSQKFIIMPNGNKYAIIVQTSTTAICIYHDNPQNGGKVVADPGQHQSSWFEIVPILQGPYANKGYLINTFNGKSLDLDAGNIANGSNVIQWETHLNWNQAWLILPADQQISFPNNPYQPTQPAQKQGFSVEKEGIFKKNTLYALDSAANHSKCLKVNQEGFVVIGDIQNLVNEKYLFEYEKKYKGYRIKTVVNGQYLNGPGLFAGVDIVIKPKGDEYQLGENWTITPSQKFNNGFSFKSFSDHAIDVPGGNFSNGTRVQKHGFHGGANQVFYVVER